jgi:hypothetical protein
MALECVVLERSEIIEGAGWPALFCDARVWRAIDPVSRSRSRPVCSSKELEK